MAVFMEKRKNQKIIEAFRTDGEMIAAYLDELKKHHTFEENEKSAMDQIKSYVENINTYLSGIAAGIKKAH